ncbi:MAG: hypothetical protein ACYDCF_09115 [Burkholderiales bacterium]
MAKVGGYRSLEVAANALRVDEVSLPSAVRWLRRRVRRVHEAMKSVYRLVPEPFMDNSATHSTLQPGRAEHHLLLQLRRTLTHEVLAQVYAPLGFLPSGLATRRRNDRNQHNMGPDTAEHPSYGGTGIKTATVSLCSPRQPHRPLPNPCRRRPRSCGYGMLIGA